MHKYVFYDSVIVKELQWYEPSLPRTICLLSKLWFQKNTIVLMDFMYQFSWVGQREFFCIGSIFKESERRGDEEEE